MDKEIDDIVTLCMEIGGVEVPGYSQYLTKRKIAKYCKKYSN